MLIVYDYSKAFDKLHYDIIIKQLVQTEFPCDFVL